MDNVRQLRPTPPGPETAEPPAVTGGEFSVESFIENSLSHTLYLFEAIQEVTDPEEFKAKAQAIQQDVATWPL